MPRPLIPVLWVVGSLLALLLLAALTAPLWLDRERIARDLEGVLGEALGSPVQIGSVSGLRLLPTPRLLLDRVAMPAHDTGPRAEADGVRLVLAAAPLIAGQIAVQSLTTERLRLHWANPLTRFRLTLTAHGVTVGPIAAGHPGQLRARVQLDGTAPDLAADLTLDAGFQYSASPDHNPGAHDAVDQDQGEHPAAGRVTIAPLRLQSHGLVIGAGHRLALDLSAVAEFDPATSAFEVTDLALTSGSLQLMGTALLRPGADGLELTGNVWVPAFDLRDWLQRHGHDLGRRPDRLRRVAFETAYRGQFTAHRRQLDLMQTRLLVDATRVGLTARLIWPGASVASASAPPSWPWTAAGLPAGAIVAAIDRLDLDAYLATAASTAGVGDDAARAGIPSSGPAAAPVAWDGTPTPPALPVPAGDTADPVLTWLLEAGQLRLGGLAYDAPVVAASTDRDGLVLDLTAALYGGPLSARLTWQPPPEELPENLPEEPPEALRQPPSQGLLEQPRVAAPRVGLRADAAGVDVGRLLADLTDDRPAVTGIGTLRADVSGRGANLERLRQALGGEVALAVHDGAVTGIDLPGLIRLAAGPGAVRDAANDATSGAATDAPTSDEPVRDSGTSRTDTRPHHGIASTPFVSLSASASGIDGQFVSDDISARSKLLEVAGNGQVDLTRETLALDLIAWLRRPADGSGIRELEDLPIPITLSGPWAAPHWQVDTRAVLAELARRALDRQGGDLLQDLEDRIGVPGLRQGLEEGLRGLLGR